MKKSFISSLVVTICFFFCSVALAFNFPWSDASKYRSECSKSCIEESFGKARVSEINMRCSSRCDHLPWSPKDLWESYDRCESINQRYKDFYKKNGSEIASCQLARDEMLNKCKKQYGSKKTTSNYVPGDYANEHIRERNYEQCQQRVRDAETAQCSKLAIETIGVGAPQECSRPTVSRPK